MSNKATVKNPLKNKTNNKPQINLELSFCMAIF